MSLQEKSKRALARRVSHVPAKHRCLDEIVVFCQENDFVIKYQPTGDGTWQKSCLMAMPGSCHSGWLVPGPHCSAGGSPQLPKVFLGSRRPSQAILVFLS